MRKLSFTLSLLFCISILYGQSPHGKNFVVDCSKCHTTEGWKVDLKKLLFDHDNTRFKLAGQHKAINCRSCHKSLEFATSKKECLDCHSDLHEGTLGPDCSRCHTPKSWIVENISEIHRQGRFPLIGAHQLADCRACHISGSTRRFDPLGIDCYDCHKANYLATSKPNHQQAGFSTNCVQCHKAGSAGWLAGNIEHSFFPLTAGHDISCTLCHTNGSYSKITAECFSCHATDYNAAKDPDHQHLNLSHNCLDCHTTSPKWKPAKFAEHDGRFFPVYSGSHSDTWTSCTDCHKQTGSYAEFTCIDCHEHDKSRMDNSHDEANGYQYNSLACFTCHPTGREEGGFNHSQTQFPLTGAHTSADCAKCHIKGFAGTAMDCNSCHKAKYDQAQAPVHTTAGIPMQCETCHSTIAWTPSSFNHGTTGFVLTGGHSRIAQCADCHKGIITEAKRTCVPCHQVQYDNARDHRLQAFPLDCLACHTVENWQAVTFDHALSKFPLTGAHIRVDCALCHKNGYAGTPTECNSCHGTNYSTAQNPNHAAAGIPVVCETCHNTTAWRPSVFNHATTGFALSGGHSTIVQCSLCHKGTVLNTRTECIACHQVQYDNAKDHKAQSYPLNCGMCHNANNWLNATFNHSQTGFPLTGAHLTTLCAKCHINGFQNTPNTCYGCHASKYNSTSNPNHVTAQFPTNCEACHNSTAWTPSTWNHDSQYFPIYSGKHKGKWTQCSECHTTVSNYTVFSCIDCHEHSNKASVDREHQGKNGYAYNSIACYNCHPRG
ncbi:MAG: hypothetical protein WC699_16555 [Bacteroidales bacterium]|jgi:hypothetical protein